MIYLVRLRGTYREDSECLLDDPEAAYMFQHDLIREHLYLNGGLTEDNLRKFNISLEEIRNLYASQSTSVEDDNFYCLRYVDGNLVDDPYADIPQHRIALGLSMISKTVNSINERNQSAVTLEVICLKIISSACVRETYAVYASTNRYEIANQ
jgi:hypothetical protein